MVPLEWYLILAAALFCIGVYGVLARRNAIAVLMSCFCQLRARCSSQKCHPEELVHSTTGHRLTKPRIQDAD